jgi:hypothetical protein
MLAVAHEFLPRIRRNEPMSRHTSWHVGGVAEIYFTPRDRTDLAAFLKSVPAETPLQWIGLGSNLLVRDGGIQGVVISTQGTLDRLERSVPTACTARRASPAPASPASASSGASGRRSSSRAFPAHWAALWR